MAQTTTAVNACDVAIWLDNGTLTPTDIGGSSNNVDLDFDHDIGEFRTFASRWPGRLECGKDANFTLNIVYSTTADEAFDILKTWYFASSPGNRTLSVYIPDKDVGSDHFQGEFKIASLSWTAGADEAGPIMVTANLLPDGEVTHSTLAT